MLGMQNPQHMPGGLLYHLPLELKLANGDWTQDCLHDHHDLLLASNYNLCRRFISIPHALISPNTPRIFSTLCLEDPPFLKYKLPLLAFCEQREPS